MQRFKKVAEALKQFPASIWGEPDDRHWNPEKQVGCITRFRYELDHLQKLIEATSTLVDCGYPLAEISSCVGHSIEIEQKVPHDPTVTFAINDGLLEKIEQYMVLNPDIKHDVGIHILCVMEATSEYLTNRIAEETTFLGHLTMEIETENEPQMIKEVIDGSETDRDETEPARSPDTVVGVELEEGEIQSGTGDNPPLAEKRTAESEPADDQS